MDGFAGGAGFAGLLEHAGGACSTARGQFNAVLRAAGADVKKRGNQRRFNGQAACKSDWGKRGRGAQRESALFGRGGGVLTVVMVSAPC